MTHKYMKDNQPDMTVKYRGVVPIIFGSLSAAEAYIFLLFVVVIWL